MYAKMFGQGGNNHFHDIQRKKAIKWFDPKNSMFKNNYVNMKSESPDTPIV